MVDLQLPNKTGRNYVKRVVRNATRGGEDSCYGEVERDNS